MKRAGLQEEKALAISGGTMNAYFLTRVLNTPIQLNSYSLICKAILKTFVHMFTRFLETARRCTHRHSSNPDGSETQTSP